MSSNKSANKIEKVDTKTQFHLGSISKTFTGALVLKLQEDGLIDINKEITNYLPEEISTKIPNSDKITVKNLLNHKSGVPNFTYMELTKCKNKDELYDTIKNKKNCFKPNEKFQYSNMGYVILGSIIEHTTGKTLPEAFKEKLFEPLNLKNTILGDAEISDNQSR